MVWLAMALIALVGFVVLVAVVRGVADQRVSAAATRRLEVDDEQVCRVLADGRIERLRWDEIVEVEVITRAERGPGDDGVMLVLVADDTEGCLLTSRLAAEHGVIERLSSLAGFDVRRLVLAMERPGPSRTTCWTKEHPG